MATTATTNQIEKYVRTAFLESKIITTNGEETDIIALFNTILSEIAALQANTETEPEAETWTNIEFDDLTDDAKSKVANISLKYRLEEKGTNIRVLGALIYSTTDNDNFELLDNYFTSQLIDLSQSVNTLQQSFPIVDINGYTQGRSVLNSADVLKVKTIIGAPGRVVINMLIPIKFNA